MIAFVTYVHHARGDAHRPGKCKLALAGTFSTYALERCTVDQA